jgi:hypothetical protein
MNSEWRFIRGVLLYSLGIWLALCPIAFAQIVVYPLRTWDIEGQNISGRFVKLRRGELTLELRDESQEVFPIQRASAIDQIFARQIVEKQRPAPPLPKEVPSAVQSLVSYSWTVADVPRGLLPGIVIHRDGDTSYVAVPYYPISFRGEKEQRKESFAIRTAKNIADPKSEIPANLAYQAPVGGASSRIYGEWSILAVAADKVPAPLSSFKILEDYNQVPVQIWSIHRGTDDMSPKLIVTDGSLVHRSPVPKSSKRLFEEILIDCEQPLQGTFCLVLDSEGEFLGFATPNEVEEPRFATFVPFDPRVIAKPMILGGYLKKQNDLGANQALVKVSLHDPLNVVESARLLIGKRFPKMRKGNSYAFKVPQDLSETSDSIYQVTLKQGEPFDYTEKGRIGALTQQMLPFEGIVQFTPEEWNSNDLAYVQLIYKDKSGKEHRTSTLHGLNFDN